jgi:putative membrane protein
MKWTLMAALSWLSAFSCSLAPAPQASEAAFVEQAASTGMLDVRLAYTALSHAASQEVRELAQRQLAEQGKAYEALSVAANRADLEMPLDMTAEHQSLYIRLAGLRGEEFDRAYLASMLTSDPGLIAQVRAESERSRTEVADWARETLPLLEKRLEHVRSLASETRNLASNSE